MAKTDTLHIRIEPSVKQKAEETLSDLGLSITEAKLSDDPREQRLKKMGHYRDMLFSDYIKEWLNFMQNQFQNMKKVVATAQV